MRAVATLANKVAGVVTKDIPSIASDEVLVKIVGVAINPTDWKHIEYISPPGVTVGCDYSGVVEKIGSDVKNLKVGDHIGGFMHGSYYEHTGAFAEHAAVLADLAWKKPEYLSHEENATYGVGALTAAVSMYQRLDLPLPSKPASKPFPFLVWSGATSVGQFAVQFGKLSGLTVITTASPKNHELLKSLGAEYCFDYNDPDVVKKIKEASNNKLEYALDCISLPESHEKTAASIGENGGKVALLGLNGSEIARKDVTFIREILYTATGKEFSWKTRNLHFPAVPEDRQYVKDFINNEFTPLLVQKKLKPNVVKHMSGGLDGITEGLAYMKAGKVSAEKLVYHIQDA